MPGMIGVTLMGDQLVRMLSLQERRESAEERLDWIDQQIAINEFFHAKRMEELNRQRREVVKELGVIIHEQIRGRE